MANSDSELQDKLRKAAYLLRDADGVLITAGAGMGVDSGLPDFRGNEGMWQAYPALKQAQLSFTQIATPSAFESMPELAWGFYGHRLQKYRDVVPHAGFGILLALADRMPQGAFVFTSNVDGHFQKAGFSASEIVECHGSIRHLQCCTPCNDSIVSSDSLVVDVDNERCLLRSPLPRCPHCGGLMRPNILQFNDSTWLTSRTDLQITKLQAWLQQMNSQQKKKLVVLEIGAGVAISTVRNFGERQQVPMIRINPLDYGVRDLKSVGLQLGALDGLQLLWATLNAIT
ncbi:SIR2 family NAD-dependent protein deacylase [Undibacterium danionis]|uniref:protein acetyllysine N-acetyltransferase n=1 Tax=Undibacterium danionis TaxID=1812100 RepID=A0ABV6IBR1_9BURK